MVASSVTVWAPPDNGNLPNNVVRPGITVAWTGGVGPFNVRYTWDDDPTFANGNGRRQVVTNTSVTSPDNGYPTADLALLTAGTTWYVKADVIDTGDSNAELSDTDNDFTYLDPNDQNRYRYLLANVGFGFDDQDTPAGGWGTSIGGTAGADGQNNPSLLNQFRYLLANVGVGFSDYDDPAGGWGTSIGGTEGPDGNWETTNRHLYALGNVGVGFSPTDDPIAGWGTGGTEGPDGLTIDLPRFLYALAYLDTSQPCPYVFSLSQSTIKQGQSIVVTGQGLVSATSPTADAYGAEVRLYESPSFSASYVSLTITGYTAGTDTDTITATIPGGATSGFVAVVHTSGTPSCSGSNFQALTVIALEPDRESGWWIEVWNLRNDTAVVRPLPNVYEAEFEQIRNDIGRGSITIPADHPDLSEILDRSATPPVQRLVKIYLHGRFAYAFVPVDHSDPWVEDGAARIRVFGPGQESILGWARALWFDYPAIPSQSSVWLHGSSDNALPEGDMEPDNAITNGDFEDAVREPWARLGTATTYVGTDDVYDGVYACEVTPSAVGDGIAAEFNVEDGFRAFVDVAVKDPTAAGDDITVDVIDPASSVSIVRSGSTATVTHTGHGFSTSDVVSIFGCTQTEYNGEHTITVTGADSYTFTVSGTPATPATGDPTAALVVASQTVAPTTALWQLVSLNWMPDAGGSQQTETVTLRIRYTDTAGTPHKFIVDNAAAYVRPNFDLTRARCLVGLSRDYVAEGLHSAKWEFEAGADSSFVGTVSTFPVEPNQHYTWTMLVTGPVGEQISVGLRLGGIRTGLTHTFAGLGTFELITLEGDTGPEDETGRFAIAGLEASATSFYGDRIRITPGDPAANAGTLVTEVIAAAQARGTLPFVQTDFDGTLDSNGNAWPETLAFDIQPEWSLWDMLEKLVGYGYELEFAPTNFRAGGDSGWTLRLFAPLGLGTDWSSAPDGPAILPNENLETVDPSSSPPLATVVFAEGNDGYWSVAASDASTIAALERREEFVRNRTGGDSATLFRTASHRLSVATNRGSQYSVGLIGDSDPLPYFDFLVGDRLRAHVPKIDRDLIPDGVYSVAAVVGRLTAGPELRFVIDLGNYRVTADRARELLLSRILRRETTENYRPGTGSVRELGG